MTKFKPPVIAAAQGRCAVSGGPSSAHTLPLSHGELRLPCYFIYSFLVFNKHFTVEVTSSIKDHNADALYHPVNTSETSTAQW